MINSILMICTGNICRSPLAEAEMQRLMPHLKIASAGVAALVGRPADAKAVVTGKKYGLDLSRHIARQVNDTLVYQHDFILVMAQGHRRWLVDRYPQVLGRVELLGRWNDDQAVRDPFNQPQQIFEAVYQQINAGCTAWKERLERRHGV